MHGKPRTPQVEEDDMPSDDMPEPPYKKKGRK